jgi:hypothetical protein
MYERIVGEPEDDVAHVVRRGRLQLGEDSFHLSLVLVGLLGRPHYVAGDQPPLH